MHNIHMRIVSRSTFVLLIISIQTEFACDGTAGSQGLNLPHISKDYLPLCLPPSLCVAAL